MKDAKLILAETLSERTARNPHYSLRAFARDLDISPQQLSNVMTGRRGLSSKLAEKVVDRLELGPQERAIFCESLKAKFALSKAQKVVAQARLNEIMREATVKTLELDLFKTISSWHHLALIELVKLSQGKQSRIAWFAKNLGLTENEVRLSLSRLERLDLITRTEKGYIVNQDTVISDKGIPTDAVKSFHQQILEKAITALACQSGNERYGSSSTMPIKVKDLERAKKLIQKFRLEFTKEVSDTLSGEEVYGLSLQFFRLTEGNQIA